MQSSISENPENKPIQNPPSKLGIGILAGVSTGVFWGIPFLAPQVLKGYSAIEMSFGRFFFFGVISLFWLKRVVAVFKALSVKDRWIAFVLSATGFWFYSSVLFWGVQLTDGVVSSLILGLLPLTIPIFSLRSKNLNSSEVSKGKIFFFGLALIFFGLMVLLVLPQVMGSIPFEPKPTFLRGILALTACLAMWTWFAIQNSKFLQRHPQISRKDFSSLIGVISLLSILPVFFSQVSMGELLARPNFSAYLLFSVALGLGSSWLANWLWNICSFYCPPSISGPLIVFETVFGLLYSFVYEVRIPHLHEAAAISLFLGGVFISVRAQLKSR